MEPNNYGTYTYMPIIIIMIIIIRCTLSTLKAESEAPINKNSNTVENADFIFIYL